MRKFNGIEGMKIACQMAHELFKDNKNERIVIGITGPVATGKTKFTQELIRQIEIIGQKPVISLPFDLWINPQGLEKDIYKGKFFLGDFMAAVECAKKKLHFLTPRYDLHRMGWAASYQHAKPTTQEVFWEGRIFSKIESEESINLAGSLGTYKETTSGRAYSFFPNNHVATYVTDGTLIAQKGLREYYDLLIYITAPWVNRVANMARRFNRNEVFGLTDGSMATYIKYLADEAKSCADKEILEQLNQDMIMIEYSPMNLSNYLDLWYLKELISNSTEINCWVKKDEVDNGINNFIGKLSEEYNSETLEKLRNELEHLILAKHLLCLEKKDEILKELSMILK